MVALVWSGTYEENRDFHFGIPTLGLDLSVGHWTPDGLLTVFFLAAGIDDHSRHRAGLLHQPAEEVPGRRLCTRMSRTSPSWSTARHRYRNRPLILMKTPSRCHLPPGRDCLQRSAPA